MGLKLKINNKNEKSSSFGLLDDKELEQPLSPTTEYLMSDVATLYVLAFLELEIPVDFPTTVAFLNDIFINIHPRLSSIVINDKEGRKIWKRVIVDVENHMKVTSFPEELSSEHFNEQFDNYISKIATSQLPPNKPLWELHIINCPKGYHAAAIFVFKFHHAIGDGTSLMAGVLSCIKRVDDPSLPLTFPSKKEHNAPQNMMINILKIVPQFISSIMYSLYDFGQGVGLLMSEDGKTPIRSGTTDMTLPSSTRVCSLTFSLNDVKRVKALLGVTVNDIVVGVIFLGTRLYIQETDQEQLKNARSTASIFVNVRGVRGNTSLDEMRKGKTWGNQISNIEWGNRISNIELTLPKLEDEELTNPLKFIKKAHKIIKNKRNGAYGPYLMAKLLNVIKTFVGFQTAVRTFERRWRNCSFAITNIIGPTEQFSFANHPVKGFYFVPTGINLSLVVSVLSYMEELRLGLVVENGFINSQKLIACVEKAFQLIFQAAQTNSNYFADQ